MFSFDSQNFFKTSSLDICKEQHYRISTDNKTLDKHLKGGIPLGKLIELIGSPGAGKTQMCMKLCLNVQVPRNFGGLEGESLYIDTRRDFNPSRLRELAVKVEQDYGKSEDFTVDQMLNNVHYVQCTTVANLIAQVRLSSKYLAANQNIRLIVIDSLSFALRMLKSVHQRYELLMELYTSMREVLHHHQDQVSWVVTNVFTNFYRRQSKKYCRVTAMGKMHSILVNERIWFTQNGHFYFGKREKTRRPLNDTNC